MTHSCQKEQNKRVAEETKEKHNLKKPAKPLSATVTAAADIVSITNLPKINPLHPVQSVEVPVQAGAVSKRPA